jgi:hypothetical protein
MEKKHSWWEYLEWPPGESYKCYSEFVGMDRFLQQFIGEDRQFRIQEPPNGYNAEDPGMKIVAPLINSARDGCGLLDTHRGASLQPAACRLQPLHPRLARSPCP